MKEDFGMWLNLIHVFELMGCETDSWTLYSLAVLVGTCCPQDYLYFFCSDSESFPLIGNWTGSEECVLVPYLTPWEYHDSITVP